MTQAHRRRRRLRLPGRRSLRITILSAFASIFVVGVGAIIAYSYHRSSQAVLRSSSDLFAQAADRVLAETVGYLKPPSDSVRVGADLLGRGMLSLEHPEGIRAYLAALVRAHPPWTLIGRWRKRCAAARPRGEILDMEE